MEKNIRAEYWSTDHVDTQGQGLYHLRGSSLHNFKTLGYLVAYKGRHSHCEVVLSCTGE